MKKIYVKSLLLLLVYSLTTNSLYAQRDFGDAVSHKEQPGKATGNANKKTKKNNSGSAPHSPQQPRPILENVRFANVRQDGTSISDFGETLIAEDLYILQPQITYYYTGTVSRTLALSIRIIKPDGMVMTGLASSENATYNVNCPFYPGQGNQILTGWGRPDGGIFQKGTYRFEVIHEGDVLLSSSFVIERRKSAVTQAVDLGLSVKWGSCNLGALNPEEFGAYYAWGETQPKTEYNWESYSLCEDGDDHKMIKYCSFSDYGWVDKLTQLGPEDDAASVSMGRKWRMPTKEEFEELQERCDWSWGKYNDVNGYLVTGPNGNSIFIPAGGCWDGATLRQDRFFGFYWTSSARPDFPFSAWYISLTSFSRNILGYSRYYGFSIRPVCD